MECIFQRLGETARKAAGMIAAIVYKNEQLQEKEEVSRAKKAMS
jgi:hypothetical protein